MTEAVQQLMKDRDGKKELRIQKCFYGPIRLWHRESKVHYVNLEEEKIKRKALRNSASNYFYIRRLILQTVLWFPKYCSHLSHS